ncbi:MAG TPA: TOBE-like domain-containing protein, partial [Jatrophihabitans sp.]|nr:TOBE-like domain-containing protein [Jatrophihabitans sp.]
PPHGSSARNAWPARVTGLAPLGDRVRVSVDGAPPATVDVTAAAVAELALAPGTAIWLSAKATDVSAYPAPARLAG